MVTVYMISVLKLSSFYSIFAILEEIIDGQEYDGIGIVHDHHL